MQTNLMLYKPFSCLPDPNMRTQCVWVVSTPTLIGALLPSPAVSPCTTFTMRHWSYQHMAKFSFLHPAPCIELRTVYHATALIRTSQPLFPPSSEIFQELPWGVLIPGTNLPDPGLCCTRFILAPLSPSFASILCANLWMGFTGSRNGPWPLHMVAHSTHERLADPNPLA